MYTFLHHSMNSNYTEAICGILFKYTWPISYWAEISPTSPDCIFPRNELRVIYVAY